MTKGGFGYVIGKKKRLMTVNKNANYLWQILLREIYIILKHFTTIEEMKKAFENLKTPKGQPKIEDMAKFRLFTDFETDKHDDWSNVLHYCQSSYINILEAGHIVNNHEDNNGLIFLIDFNKNEVIYYDTNNNSNNRNNINNKKKKILPLIQSATFDEILNFEDMPIKTYSEIVTEMKTNFDDFYDKYDKIVNELKKLQNLKILSKNQNAGNIEDKVDKLMDDMNWEKKKLNSQRKVVFTRLKALDLIEDE
jgi:hypothetical protein